MFDSYHAGSHTVKINAVTGAILKNHPKSWFLKIHLESQTANMLLSQGGHHVEKTHYSGEYGWVETDSPRDIIVLQMVICGEKEVLAECVYRVDYEAALSERGGEDG